ncbi:hypothetical protein HWV62_20582 [Athelia sp. TMB]|nr:hypothetical protein HWV62_20582 [Athelia sp. TMB]
MPKTIETVIVDLPVPGQLLGPDNVITVEKFTIICFKSAGVVKVSYHLPNGAQSIQLINGSMFTSHTKHKRGDMTGSRLKKSVSKRIVAQFGERQARTTYASNKTAEHLAQPLDDEQVAHNNAWVSLNSHNLLVSACSSTNQADEVLNLGKHSSSRNGSQLKSSSSTSDHGNSEFLRSISSNDPQREQHDVVSQNKHEGNSTLSMRLRRLERSVSTLHQGISEWFDTVEEVLRKESEPAPPTPSPWVAGHLPQSASRTPSLSLALTSKSQPASRTPSISVAIGGVSLAQPIINTDSFSAIPATEASLMNLTTIKLGDNDFTFDRSTVPDPPAVYFSDNLARLFEHWYSSDLLKINGLGIPVKHWQVIYRKTGAWATLRTAWGNYKLLVDERERYPTEAHFWPVYSIEGEHMTQTQILARLATARSTQVAQDVQDAMRFFDNNLSHPDADNYFTYKKKGRQVPLSKNTEISRKWRSLLHDNEIISTRWDLMCRANQIPPAQSN